MAQIPIPFTNQSIDTGDGAKSNAGTYGAVILGFALLGVAQSFGDDIRSFVMDRVPFGSSGDGGNPLQLGA